MKIRLFLQPDPRKLNRLPVSQEVKRDLETGVGIPFPSSYRGEHLCLS
jgi:hypothetical protein